MSDTSGVPEELGKLRKANAGLRAANVRLRELLDDKDGEIAGLQAAVAQLKAQVEALAAQVKANSGNSSKPPSSDGLGKPEPKSLRTKTGRGPGRPTGQPGVRMKLTDHPDHTVRHEPAACRGCGGGLDGARQTRTERRQVTEIPAVKAEVTEHQVIERQCPCCGTLTRAGAPDGVDAPVQYGPRVNALAACLWHGQFLSRDRACAALGEMSGCGPSPMVIAKAAKKIAAVLGPVIKAVIAALVQAEVAHFGETGFRVAGKLAWVHSASAGNYVPVTAHPKRGTEAMDAAGVLPAFTGIAVHGAWAPYDTCTGVAGHAHPCASRARHCPAKDLADPLHRLPEAARNLRVLVPRRNRPVLLQREFCISLMTSMLRKTGEGACRGCQLPAGRSRAMSRAGAEWVRAPTAR